MNVHRTARLLLTTAAAAAFTLAAVGPADARQDVGPAHVENACPFKNPLQRLGTQMIRGDELTGDGVTAPHYLPER